jgi:hypothetical protein
VSAGDPDEALGGYHAYATGMLDDAGFRGPWSRRFVGVVGLLHDGIREGCRQIVKLRFPGACPPDALDANGSTFGLPRYPRERDDRYRGRLAFKWRTHEESGSRYGLERAFAAAGLRVDVREGWQFSADPNDWMRVRFVLRWDGVVRAVKVWGSGGVWGRTGKWQDARRPEVDVMLAILKQHKPAHAVVDRVTVVLGGQIWGQTPGKKWGSDPVWRAGQAYQVSP